LSEIVVPVYQTTRHHVSEGHKLNITRLENLVFQKRNTLKCSGYYVSLGLTFTNCTFCPHRVFMCFVWVSA